MTKTLSDAIRALASPAPDDPTRTVTARLRALLPDIEVALQSGAKHADIIKLLHAYGLEITLSTFQTTLRRLRRTGHAGVNTKTEPPAPPAPASKPIPKTASFHHPSEPVDMEALINIGKRNPR